MLIATGDNQLVCGAWSTVKQIECVARSQIFIQIDQSDLSHDTAALQGERCAGTDQTATTDNANFHRRLPNLINLLFGYWLNDLAERKRLLR
jgi:hypothetical protein